VVLSCGYLHARTHDEEVSLADLVAGAEWAVAIAHAATQVRDGEWVSEWPERPPQGVVL
jgi:hypothetical protein